MTLINQIVLAFLGLCCGFTVAAGTFAFITMLGIIPRLTARTNTAKDIYWYENVIILGGTVGNVWILYEWSLFPSSLLLIAFGFFSGIFVGCLAMALAEMLRVLPILSNRVQLKEGFPLVALALALGKMVGTLFQYFW